MKSNRDPSGVRVAAVLGVLLLGVAAVQSALRLSGLGVLRRGRSLTPAVALTFEPGPDARLTGRLLDALAGAGVQVTLLWDARTLDRQPELLHRAAREGHEAGLIAGRPWSLPWRLTARLERSRQLVRAHTGREARVFRSGASPLVTLLVSRATGLRAVDGWGRLTWVPEPHARHLRPGAVVQVGPLDDAGVTRLPAQLAALAEQGYRVTGVWDLPGTRPERPRDLPATLLQGVDVLYDRLGRIRRVGAHASSLFRVGVAPYPLADVTLPAPGLPDGLTVRHGERLVEFHLDSARLVELAARPVAGRKVVQHSVHDLAAAVRDDPAWNTLPAVYSVSIFSHVLKLYGFTVLELPLPMRRRLTWWSRTLRRAYGVADPEHVHVPMLAVISREELVRRHGTRRG